MRKRTYKRRIQQKKTRKNRAQTLRGGGCPSDMSARLCDRYKRMGMDPEYAVTRNFKFNLRQALSNREKRLLPENVRVQEAQQRFNWKSSKPKFNRIRRGNYNNNIFNAQLENVHEATNANFPANTGETPMAFTGLVDRVLPELNTKIRTKIYRNNINQK